MIISLQRKKKDMIEEEGRPKRSFPELGGESPSLARHKKWKFFARKESQLGGRGVITLYRKIGGKNYIKKGAHPLDQKKVS